ncbi:PLP-dependent transferase, partial [Rhizobiaceae sp. 2RAB30]
HVGRVAAEFAGKLGGLPGIGEVLHPALPSMSGHDVWRRDFRGASGVFTVRLKPCSQAVLDRALGQFEVFAIGASWGGTRSLVAPMTLGSDRTYRTVDPDLIFLRISIGLESPEALWADLERFAVELT